MSRSTGTWVDRASTSVRRLTSLTLHGAVFLLLGLAVICSSAVILAAYSLNAVNDTAVPLQAANKAILQDLTDAESSVRRFALDNGDTGDLQPYLVAMSYLPQDEQTLRGIARGHASLEAAVARQEEATDLWLVDYVNPQLDQVGEIDQNRLFIKGNRRFDDVRSANLEVDRAIDETITTVGERARRLLFWTLAAVVLLPLIMIAFGTVLARRLNNAMLEPLDHLSQVLARLRSGDLTARAAETGPAEIREIAQALNVLAEDSLRSQGVEHVVVERLGEIDRVRTELIATVSHELRTPLTSVQGYLQLLADEISDQLDDNQSAMLDIVRRNLNRLAELISNLLTLSRVEEASLKLDVVDLRAVASEVAGDLRLTAGARAISVRTIHSVAPVVMIGDRTQVTRALSNLVANAVKFSEPGNTVEIRVAQKGRVGVVEVVDEGIGIPEADLPEVGGRFFRASNATRAQIAGTGLGLRIVQTIVDRHGGRLSIDSVEHVGTTVTMHLPLSQNHQGGAGTHGAEAAGAAGEQNSLALSRGD